MIATRSAQAIRERQLLFLRAQPTSLRRCLRCDEWLHSTGPDHRICDLCKGIVATRPGVPGSRVTAC